MKPEPKNKRQLSEVMVENSSYGRGHLKSRLIKEGILKEICAECGQAAVWKGRRLVLVIDHINGVNNDHRLDNLRLLCPNCNSQTDTFAGKNLKYKDSFIKKKELNKKHCTRCPAEISRNSKNGLCVKCFADIRKVTTRPIKELLIKKVKEQGYSATGREYGVSDNAIRKWMK